MPVIPEQIRKETMLYHQSFGLEWDQDGSLNLEDSWDPRKIYFKSDFLPEKWAEIELAQSKVWEKNQENTKGHSQSSSILIICGITILTIVMIILLAYLARKKQVRNKIK